MTTTPLTPGQQATLNAIRQWYKKSDQTGPSIVEIMKLAGNKSAGGMRSHLAALETLGYITRIPGKWRSVALTEKGRRK